MDVDKSQGAPSRPNQSADSPMLPKPMCAVGCGVWVYIHRGG